MKISQKTFFYHFNATLINLLNGQRNATDFKTILLKHFLLILFNLYMTEKIKRHIRFNTPIKLSIPNEIITSIKASADHTYCITSSGNVYCWG